MIPGPVGSQLYHRFFNNSYSCGEPAHRPLATIRQFFPQWDDAWYVNIIPSCVAAFGRNSNPFLFVARIPQTPHCWKNHHSKGECHQLRDGPSQKLIPSSQYYKHLPPKKSTVQYWTYPFRGLHGCVDLIHMSGERDQCTQNRHEYNIMCHIYIVHICIYVYVGYL